MCSVRLNLGVFENNESFKHLLGFLRPEDRNSIQPLFTKTASMSKNGHTRKSLYPQWIETGSERTCLLLVLLPVEFTCIKHFLSLTPSGCI